MYGLTLVAVLGSKFRTHTLPIVIALQIVTYKCTCNNRNSLEHQPHRGVLVRDKATIVREEIHAEPLGVRVSPIAANLTISHQVTVTMEGKEKVLR